MRYDIIFHLTTSRYYKEYKSSGNFEPESLETNGFIPCAGGKQIETVANDKFSDHQKILLLVIDVSTLQPQVKYEEDKKSGEKFPHIYGPLNTNAIIDKIEIQTEKDGSFDISFNSYS